MNYADATLPGVNVLIEGPTGTGKTYSIGTAVDAVPDIEFFYVGLESGLESLFGYWTDRGKTIPKNLHWIQIKPSDADISVLMKGAKTINTFSNEALGKMQDTDKSKYNSFIKLLETFNNFVDQDGVSWGPIEKWGTDKCLIVDALTGINVAAMSLVVGGKPIKSLVDWGIAMDQVEKLLRALTGDVRAHFILLSHIEQETDQILGGKKITVGTLGVKLASKIPPMFSDVILAKREGTEFRWSTADPSADLKTRNLPISDKISPNLGAIFKKWQSRAFPSVA